MTNDEIQVKIAELKGMNFELRFIPEWPENIADAWELVEEMRNAPGCVNVQGDYQDKGYVCYFRKYPTSSSEVYFEWAITAPRAICLAYIAWKEAQ